MKKIILTKDITINKLVEEPGSFGYVIVVQDSVGGHVVSLSESDRGSIDIAFNPGGITELKWTQDDEYTYWSSVKMTTDVTINPPSAISDLMVELVDTISAKIKWSSPQGFEGNDNSPSSLYYIVVSASPLYPNIAYEANKLQIIPKAANSQETYIIPNLDSGKRYYIGLYSDKIAFGTSKRSALSNVITFSTTALEGNATIPKRIPLQYDKIYESNVHVAFKDGELFTNYPTFKRLSFQDWIIDDAGTATGTPPSGAVASYQSYGTHQPSWYNIQRYKIIFELDGVYDLDYIYMMQSSYNNRISIHTSGDGVNWIQAFDRNDTPIDTTGWFKIPLSNIAVADIKFIMLGLYEGSGDVNAFVPYGTRKSIPVIKGEKYKKLSNEIPIIDGFGTNGFLAEKQYDWMSKVSSITRLYTPTDWFMYGNYKNQGGIPLINNTPDNIQLCSKLSQMWNFDEKMQEMLDAGTKELLITLTSCFPYLRQAGDSDGFLTKPIDPGLNYLDYAVTTNPQSYKHVARIIGALAYRWGFNANSPDIYDQFAENDGVKGLGLVRYYEFGNEMDRSWQGADDTQKSATHFAPEEMAAYMSALFDGHKGALGSGFGLKGADPSAKMLMPGLLSINYDYVSEMMLWWDVNRGKGDYPIDVINFHHYNGYYHKTDTADWSSIPAWGIAPEKGKLIEETKKMVRIRSLFAQNLQVWVSEFGYDEQLGGVYSPQDSDATLRGRHKAIWILRCLMIYHSIGIESACHYWYASLALRVEDITPGEIHRDKFSTSGLVDGITGSQDFNRKPLIGWWYVVAFRNAMQDYIFSHIVVEDGILMISETDIIPFVYPRMWAMAFRHKDTQKTIIVCWLGVEDWSNASISIKVSNVVTSVVIKDFLAQDSRLSENAVTNTVTPSVSGGLKYVGTNISETPIIVDTDYVGTPILIEPTNIKLQAVFPTSVKITWTDVNIGMNKTRIYISTLPTSGFTIAEEEYRDSSETTIAGLTENTQYYFKLQFVQDGRTSNVSAAYDIITFVMLTAPTSLFQTDSSSSSITLGWSYTLLEQAKIDGFIIYRCPLVNGEYVEAGRVANTLRSFRDSGLVGSSQYYYKVRSYKDSSLSNYSFVVGMSTAAPSYEPPTIQSAATDTSGSYIEIEFNEELKDEQTAINAFTIIETLITAESVAHPLSSIVLQSDKTKVRLYFDIPIFKNSTLTLSYSASVGALKSLLNISVNTFLSFNVVNNVSTLYYQYRDWNEISGIALNRNNLIASNSGGKALGLLKIAAGSTAIVQFNCNNEDSMFLGLDTEMVAEDYSNMDFYVRKYNNRVDYKKVSVSGLSTTDFTTGIIRFRTDGVLINFEASYNGGITWVSITTAAQPNVDLFIKVHHYNSGISRSLLNVSYIGLAYALDMVMPDAPTDMYVDDITDNVGFTENPNYSITDHEFSTNYTSLNPSWSTCTTNPVAVGDVNIPAGGFAVRVKAATGRFSSLALLSTEDLTGTINTNSKIMIQKSSGGTVLFASNILTEILDWLASYLIVEALTVQFNTSDIYYVPNKFNPTYNNGTNWITFVGASGIRPILDGQKANSSVVQCLQDYTKFINFEFRNANIEDEGGAIVRADGRKNMKFLNIIYDFGYCAMRATTGCEDFEIDTAIVRNVRNGSFRIGNPTYIGGIPQIDQSNINLKNIFLDDVANGGLIEGTAHVFHAPLVLKVTDGFHVENVRSLSGDTLHDLGIIEVCKNTTFKNVRGQLMYFQEQDGITFSNCYLPGACYFYKVDNLVQLHSHIGGQTYQSLSVAKLRANIFPSGIVMGLTQSSDIPDIENNNLVIADIGGKYININFSNGDPDFVVDDSNLTAYKATQGGNTLFVPYANRGSLNLNPYGSLRANSVGKALITGTIEGITDDIYGTPRSYPTDPGPYSGLRPDINDQPAPPTVVGDNLTRVLVASHILGESQILVSENNGLFLPYTGIINVGDIAVAENYYRFKVKSAAYRDESAIAYSPAFTDKPVDNDYTVLRTIEVNFKSEYSSPSDDANVNNYYGSGSTPVDGTTLSMALVDKTGIAAGITLANFEKGFAGASVSAAPAGTYIRSSVAIESAFSVNDSGSPSKLKLTGLDPAKFYQMYIVGCTDASNHAGRYTIGATVIDKVTTGNYPVLTSGDIYVNPAIIRFNNVAANISGEVVMEFLKIGSAYQQNVLNYLVIEETNIEKPS